MDARLKQFLLIALQSTQDGEALSALMMARRQLSKIGSTAHALLSGLSTNSPAPDPRLTDKLMNDLTIVSRQRDQAISEANRLRQEVMLLRMQNTPRPSPYQAPPPGDAKWMQGYGMTPQRMAEKLLEIGHRLTRKEADFLERMVHWKGWPTDKQLSWLEALWEKYT